MGIQHEKISINGKTHNLSRHIYCQHNEIDIERLPSCLDVHHVNGNKYDDRIENLKLLPEVDHIRLHHFGADRGNRFKTCCQCNETYDSRYKGRHKKQKFCSRECGYLYKARNQVTLNCIYCKKEYKIRKSHSLFSKYCSIKCKNMGQKGGDAQCAIIP